MENLQSNLFYSLAGVATLASFASCTGKQKPAEQPKAEPAPVNMEATRVVDTSSVKRERTGFPFESNQSSGESKFGNLKFGQNK